MKTKTLTLAIILILAAASVNLFGDSMTLYGSGIQVTSVNGYAISGGSLSFSDSSYSGNWSWGEGGDGTLSLTGSVQIASTTINGTLLSDEFVHAQVYGNGTSYQVTFAEISANIDPDLASALGLSTASFSGGNLTLVLLGSAVPEGSPFTGSVQYGGVSGGGTTWNLGSAGTPGTVSAGDPVSASEPWTLPMSLMFLGMVAGIFATLVRAKVLRFA